MTWQPATGGSQHRIPATLPKAVHEEPGRSFLEVDKACVDIFGILPRLLKSLVES